VVDKKIGTIWSRAGLVCPIRGLDFTNSHIVISLVCLAGESVEDGGGGGGLVGGVGGGQGVARLAQGQVGTDAQRNRTCVYRWL